YSAIRVYSGLMGLSNQPPSSHSPTAPVHPPKGSQDLLSYTTRRGATAGSCGAINPGDTFEISYIGSLDPTKFYSLEVANINNLTTNSQIFQNVQFLVSGIIHGSPITDGVITIWPTNDINNSGVPYLQQGVTDYTTNATSNTFPPITGIPVLTQASFILTTPQTDIGLGTAGLIITKPLQLSSVGVSSFTGFKIQAKSFVEVALFCRNWYFRHLCG
ncbi:MAG: hypothetical protein NTZ40_08360, partial [Cyanobacteria bacterium]|nr:hypothetical protein [Cyanobacteriota bacterium]